MTTKKVITLLKSIKAQETTGAKYKHTPLYWVRRDGFRLSILLKNIFNK